MELAIRLQGTYTNANVYYHTCIYMHLVLCMYRCTIVVTCSNDVIYCIDE